MPANHWTCKECDGVMYSAASYTEKEKVACIHCEAMIWNPYFEGVRESDMGITQRR